MNPNTHAQSRRKRNEEKKRKEWETKIRRTWNEAEAHLLLKQKIVFKRKLFWFVF